MAAGKVIVHELNYKMNMSKSSKYGYVIFWENISQMTENVHLYEKSYFQNHENFIIKK